VTRSHIAYFVTAAWLIKNKKMVKINSIIGFQARITAGKCVIILNLWPLWKFGKP